MPVSFLPGWQPPCPQGEGLKTGICQGGRLQRIDGPQFVSAVWYQRMSKKTPVSREGAAILMQVISREGSSSVNCRRWMSWSLTALWVEVGYVRQFVPHERSTVLCLTLKMLEGGPSIWGVGFVECWENWGKPWRRRTQWKHQCYELESFEWILTPTK